MIYVFALNAKVAASWANINGITSKQYIYVNRSERLHGVQDKKYVTAYGFVEHPDAERILALLDFLIAHRGFTKWLPNSQQPKSNDSLPSKALNPRPQQLD